MRDAVLGIVVQVPGPSAPSAVIVRRTRRRDAQCRDQYWQRLQRPATGGESRASLPGSQRVVAGHERSAVAWRGAALGGECRASRTHPLSLQRPRPKRVTMKVRREQLADPSARAAMARVGPTRAPLGGAAACGVMSQQNPSFFRSGEREAQAGSSPRRAACVSVAHRDSSSAAACGSSREHTLATSMGGPSRDPSQVQPPASSPRQRATDALRANLRPRGQSARGGDLSTPRGGVVTCPLMPLSPRDTSREAIGALKRRPSGAVDRALQVANTTAATPKSEPLDPWLICPAFFAIAIV